MLRGVERIAEGGGGDVRLVGVKKGSLGSCRWRGCMVYVGSSSTGIHLAPGTAEECKIRWASTYVGGSGVRSFVISTLVEKQRQTEAAQIGCYVPDNHIFAPSYS